MTKIAFYDSKPYDIEYFNKINKENGFNYELKFHKTRLNPDTAVLAKGYEIVCAFVNDDIGEETMKQLYDNGVRLLAMRCAGYNNVDIKSAYRKIHVARVPAYSPYAVAEHATALMLTLNRKTHKAYNRTRDGNFTLNGFLGFDLHEKTAGIIGTGKIGKVMANILKGFGMNVLLYDVYPNEEFAAENGFKYVELNELFKNSDIVTLHCPLTKETKDIINADSISRMKDGVQIINTSRGQLIDTRALIDGLKSQKIGSAGLDVYEEESDYFFEDLSHTIISDDVLARLLSFNNVLVTSHQGFFTGEAVTNIANTTLTNIKQYLAGGPIDNEICYKCETKPCAKETTGTCSFPIER